MYNYTYLQGSIIDLPDICKLKLINGKLLDFDNEYYGRIKPHLINMYIVRKFITNNIDQYIIGSHLNKETVFIGINGFKYYPLFDRIMIDNVCYGKKIKLFNILKNKFNISIKGDNNLIEIIIT